MPIDFNKSPLKNPINEDTLTRALARKWRHRLIFGGYWFKSYALPIFGLIYLALFAFARYTLGDAWDYFASREVLMRNVLLGFFVLVRINLAAVPALIICRDTNKSLWDHFRITAVNGDDVARAMVGHAIMYGAIPYAVISLASTFVYFYGAVYTFSWEDILKYSIPLFMFYFSFGMLFTALGITGALLWRNALAVLGFIVAPILLLFLSAGAEFVETLKAFISGGHVQNLGNQPITLFLGPENRLAYTAQTMSRHGFTTGPGVDTGIILSYFIGFGIVAVLLWMGIWFTLRHRLKYG